MITRLRKRKIALISTLASILLRCIPYFACPPTSSFFPLPYVYAAALHHEGKLEAPRHSLEGSNHREQLCRQSKTTTLFCYCDPWPSLPTHIQIPVLPHSEKPKKTYECWNKCKIIDMIKKGDANSADLKASRVLHYVFQIAVIYSPCTNVHPSVIRGLSMFRIAQRAQQVPLAPLPLACTIRSIQCF
jgi:hypothetical protein